jgi:hypothetical protein
MVYKGPYPTTQKKFRCLIKAAEHYIMEVNIFSLKAAFLLRFQPGKFYKPGRKTPCRVWRSTKQKWGLSRLQK